MKERPILFAGPMVRAILEGRKTQTRRVVKPRPQQGVPFGPAAMAALPGDWTWPNRGGLSCTISNKRGGPDGWAERNSPFGVPGDRLWVREKWRYWTDGMCIRIEYADGMLSVDVNERVSHSEAVRVGDPVHGIYWRPSIHMPRWASRLTLEVVSVRVERLQEISEADAIAEGIERLDDGRWKHYQNPHYGFSPDPRESFGTLWRSISGEQSWDANPWVWVVEFRRVTP